MLSVEVESIKLPWGSSSFQWTVGSISEYAQNAALFSKHGGGLGPVALLVFKTSGSPKKGLVGSTPTRLRHPKGKALRIGGLAFLLAGLGLGGSLSSVGWNSPDCDPSEAPLPLRPPGLGDLREAGTDKIRLAGQSGSDTHPEHSGFAPEG